MSALTEADTYLAIKKITAGTGGASITGYSDAGNLPMIIAGISECAVSTATSAAAVGQVNLYAYKSDGSTGAGGLSSGANLVVVKSQDNAKFIVDQEGDIKYDGGATACAWDEYCDVKLLTAQRAIMMPDGSDFKNKFSSFVDEYGCLLEQTGVIWLNGGKCGRPEGPPFVSMKGLNGLMIDSIRQIHGKVESLETQLKALSEGK